MASNEVYEAIKSISAAACEKMKLLSSVCRLFYDSLSFLSTCKKDRTEGFPFCAVFRFRLSFEESRLKSACFRKPPVRPSDPGGASYSIL